MMLESGRLGGAHVVSRSTVALMTSDHLGARPTSPVGPGELLLGVPGYTFGLGFMVRIGVGTAGVPGSAGEFMWGGAGGTFFWVDPKEELAVVFMSRGRSLPAWSIAGWSNSSSTPRSSIEAVRRARLQSETSTKRKGPAMSRAFHLRYFCC
jgi:CubicO group peptidase (beta-lactamase class C family)